MIKQNSSTVDGLLVPTALGSKTNRHPSKEA